MNMAAQKNNKRYLPHMASTREGAVKLYRQTKDMDFVLRALLCFGYAPEIIRTDNGGEFTHTQRIAPPEIKAVAIRDTTRYTVNKGNISARKRTIECPGH